MGEIDIRKSIRAIQDLQRKVCKLDASMGAMAGTDDQTALEVAIDPAILGLTATNVSAGLAELLGIVGGMATDAYAFTGSFDGTPIFAPQDMFSGPVPTNETPFIVPIAGQLDYITAGTDGGATWDANVYINGVAVVGATLSIAGADAGQSAELNIVVAAGDEIRLVATNFVAITNPRITAHFK